MTESYKQLRDLILKSEGKKIEDELGFGCRIKKEGKVFTLTGKAQHPDYWRLTDENGLIDEILLDGQACRCDHPSPDKTGNDVLVEILGRDINLERVLKRFTSISMPEVTLDIFGAPALPGIQIRTKDIVFIWEIGKPAHAQSEETLKSLIELLK